jgi:hypothetical protein
MENATIYRGTGRDAYAVQVEGWPGIVEICCSQIEMDVSRIEFDRLVRTISPINVDSLMHVSISMGEYSLGKRAFVDCSMRFQSDSVKPASDWHPEKSPMTSVAKSPPPIRTMKRFTSSSFCDSR